MKKNIFVDNVLAIIAITSQRFHRQCLTIIHHS